ncbi:MAG TPA: TRAP transporter substrate-binding protein DctP [candidate division Zixibacteria bacterium]|nr:TRAP transporter substrate-binding protein DctP [candidate division Zixibacteria bacterium]
MILFSVQSTAWSVLPPERRMGLAVWFSGAADICSRASCDDETRALKELESKGVRIFPFDAAKVRAKAPAPKGGPGWTAGRVGRASGLEMIREVFSMRRLAWAFLFLATMVLASPAFAEPVMELLYPPKLEEYAQCARLLASAGDAPVRLQQKVLKLHAILPAVEAVRLAKEQPSIVLAPVGYLSSNGTPGLAAIIRPFVFRDLAHFQAFSRSPLFEEEAGRAEDLRPLAVAYAGTAYLAARKPVREPGDLDGLRVNSIMDLKLWRARGERLRAFPYVYNDNLLSALKHGVINAAVFTPIEALRFGLSEVASHYNLIDVQRYFMALAVSVSAWREMGHPQRQALSAWAKRMADRCSARNFDAETRAIEALKKQGVTIVEPNHQAFEAERPDAAEDAPSEEARVFLRKIQAIR